MTLSALITRLKNDLKTLYSNEERDQIIARIFEELLGYSRIDLRLKADTLVTSEIEFQLSEISQRLLNDEPIQYVLGYAWFDGLKLKVNSDVLIPRQETEELTDWITRENTISKPFIIDICTGSGCIALALKKNIPQAEIKAIDISPDALKVAGENSLNLNLHIDLIESDILKTDLSFHNVDIIVSNPPYVRRSESLEMKKNVVAFEPGLALFVSDSDPLIFYRHIAIHAKKWLRENGRIYLEINEDLSRETAGVLEGQGFHDITIRKDLNDRFRMISATNR